MGFWELGLIALVALLLLGPKRLPALARQVGRWFSTASRWRTKVKKEADDLIKKSSETTDSSDRSDQ